MSVFTFPAVCLQSEVSLVFPIWKTCLLSFGPLCSCQCKSGRTLGPVDADVRKDFTLHTPGTHQWPESIAPWSRPVGAAAMNCKCETPDLPAMQTPWCIIAHLGIWAHCKKQGLTARWVLWKCPFSKNILCRSKNRPDLQTRGFIVTLWKSVFARFHPRGSLYLYIPSRIQPCFPAAV